MVLEEASKSGPTTQVVEPERLTLLTHDIRSALSDVLGGLGLIDASDIPTPLRSQFDEVRASANLLSRLLEDALSAWIGQNLDLRRDKPVVHLPRLIRALHLRCELFSRYAGTSQRINVSISDNMPELVRIDGLSLERILTNVLANALRHVPNGEISFTGQLDDDGALIFDVQDDGPGFPDNARIAQDDLGQLDPVTRGMPGSGYGLKIAHDLSRRLGGTLHLANREDGSGARVSLHVPSSAWSEVARDASSRNLPDLTGKTVLLADDSGAHRMLLAQYLGQMGAHCLVASDAARASAILRDQKIDLAILDIDLPMQSGLTVMQAHKARTPVGADPGTRFIAVTAYCLPGTAESLVHSGFDGVITKPVGGVSTFGKNLAKIINVPLQRTSSENPNEGGARGFVSEHLERLMSTVGPAVSGKLLNRLLNDLQEAARELKKGVAETNARELRRWSHVAGSVAGSIGPTDVQLLAVRLTSALDLGGAAQAAVHARALIASIEELIEEITVFRQHYGDMV